MQPASILLLGHGAVGRAFEHLLGERHELAIWERDLDSWEETLDLESSVPGRDFIFFTLPTSPHEELARRIAPLAGPDCICLSIAKGLDDAGRPPAAIFDAELDAAQPRGVIYGPMIARDLQQGRAGFAMLGSVDAAVYRRVAGLFADTPLHLAHSDDVIGCSWAVIAKNIYVPLIGAADALELGDNVRGFLVCAVLDELDAVCRAMGGRAGTAYTMAGLGDLVTTATSEASHHRRIGADLAAGSTEHLAGEGANIRSEGVHALAMVERHQLLDLDHYPLMQLMRNMLDEPARAAERLRAAIERWG